MIDVHTHLNDDKLFNQSVQIIKELPKHNISKVIVPSCDKKMIANTLKLITFDNVFGALGIHPSNADEWDDDLCSLIEKECQNNKIVAIGEIGLDLHYKNSNLKLQQQVFLQQLILADKLKMPVILHLRDAWKEFFDFYEKNKNLFCNGVDVHCFDGDVNVAKRLVDCGFFISLTALSTENKTRLKEMIEYLPLDRIMVETDSPYLLPSDFRHTQEYNTPQNVNWVANRVAEYKHIDIHTIDDITTKNAYKLFKRLGEYNG